VLDEVFELAFGLKVNFYKSKIGVFGMEESVMKRYVELLNCRMMNEAFLYLGFLLEQIQDANILRRDSYQSFKKDG